MPAVPSELLVWRFCDGRRGHEAQTHALLAAFGRRQATLQVDIDCRSTLSGLRQLRRQLRADPRRPDLLLGAGHATHLPLLAARLLRGGRAIVLMRPSLPLRWFDACLVPQHDDPPRAPNVIATDGPLTRPAPGAARDAASGMIVVGGPSRHFRWDTNRIGAQLRAILARGERHWLLGDSPRTPPDTSALLRTLAVHPHRYARFDAQPQGWVAAQLARTGVAWISCDSMSMIYEVLGSGTPLGVLELEPRHDNDKLARQVRQLAARQMLTLYSDWLRGGPLPAPAVQLDEAARCAAELHRRLALGTAPAAP
jgi:hypothetical protein